MSEWTEESLGRLASIEIGGTPSRDVPAFWASENSEGFPWASIADLGPKFVSATKERITRLGVLSSNVKPVRSGTLMMSFKLTIGRAGIAACDLFTNEAIAAFVPAPQTLDGNFLYYLLPPIARNAVTDVAIKGSTLNKQTLSKLKLRFPKDMRQQRRIAEILSTLDEAIAQTEALIAKHQQIKAGLMHDLFTRGITPDGHLRPTREQVPDLYKESPLGWIPKEWEVVELKSEIGIAHGFAFSGEYFSDTPPGEVLLTPGSFHRDGGLYFTVENTKYFQGPIPPTTVLQNGEMVTVMTDLSPQTLILGRFAIVETPFPLLHNQRIGRVILKRKDRWDWSYLCYALNDERVRRKIIVEATGTTVRHTSPVRILGNQVARSCLEEQRRSIEVLRSIERRIVEEQASLMKSKQEKHGLMHDLLTGRVPVNINEVGVVQ